MKLGILAFLIFLVAFSYGQVIPEPGTNLTHTQIMFEYPACKDAVKYEIEISRWDSVKKVEVPFLKQSDNTTATLLSNLEFGKEYRWKYKAYNARLETIFTSSEYTFYIKKPATPNLDYLRERIIPSNCREPLTGLIVQDYAKTIFDRKGNPVYYVPESPPILNTRFFIRDLRMTSGGTITLLSKVDAIEMDLNGHIIWRAPNDGKVSGDPTESYHHGFSRLQNGNYMVMGNKFRTLKAPNDTISAVVEFGTLIEYDLSGNIVWKWDSQDYLDVRDIFSRKTSDTSYNVGTHSNSFDISEDGRFVYYGFREISRIVKIDKASGKVVASFGTRMPSGEAKYANGFFNLQHSSYPLKDGNLAIFNNDSIDKPEVTSCVEIISQPDDHNPTSKLIWKFDCKFDTLTNGKSFKNGNIYELPDNNLLVNLGYINRTIELTRDKKIVWDAFTEKWDPKVNKWIPFPQFRSSYISSLYPCYFTANIGGNGKLNGPGANASLIICNEGTEADSYEIIFKKGSEITKSSSKEVLPNQSTTITIPVIAEPFTIKIVSSLDQRRYRIIHLPGESQESTLNSLPGIDITDIPQENNSRQPK
jgi:hypothetical protein